MRFRFERWFLPSLFFLVSMVVVFMVFPLELKTKDRIYNFATDQYEQRTEMSYAPIFFQAIIALAMFAWFSGQTDLPETSLLRDGYEVLEDPVCERMESHHGIHSPFSIAHDQVLGDWTDGKVAVMAVLNSMKEYVYIFYVQNADYNTTQVRPQRNVPYLSHSKMWATVEDAIRNGKPSMRKTEEKLFEDMMRKMRTIDPEKREYYQSKAERTLAEEEQVQ